MDAIEELRNTLVKELAAKDAYIKRLEETALPVLQDWYEYMCDCEHGMDTNSLQLLNELLVKTGREPVPWTYF